MGHGKSCYALTRVMRKLLLSFTLISCLNFPYRAKHMLGFGVFGGYEGRILAFGEYSLG